MKTPSPDPALPPPGRPLSLVQRLRGEEDDEPQAKPLEWGIIRRLFGYMRVHPAKRNALVVLTMLRAAQLPALPIEAAVVPRASKQPYRRGEKDVDHFVFSTWLEVP